MLAARKSVSEKNNLLIWWCKVKTWKSCFINTAVSCVYKTEVKIFRDKLRLHEICLRIFFYPKQLFFLSLSYMHSCSFSLFRLFLLKILRQKAGIQVMLFRSGSTLGGLCEKQLLLLPIYTLFSTSYLETDINCRVSLCQKANYLWLCNLIIFEVKHRKHKLTDFPLCLPSLSLPPLSVLSSSLSFSFSNQWH